MLRKKWLSLLVACAMIAAMMPTAAFAADGDVNPDATTNQNAVVDQATDETADNENEQSGESEKSEETQEPKMSTETKEVRTPSNGAMLLENEDGVIKVGDTVYPTLEQGLSNIQDGSKVELLQDVVLTSTLKITANNVTFDLGKHKISGNVSGNLIDLTNGATQVSGVKIMNGTLAGGTKHTLNVWNATGVTLEDLTLDNSNTTGGAPLIVGSSNVTLNGKITVVEGDKSWYAINVDCRKVGENPVSASLTVGAQMIFKGKLANKVGICVDNVYGKDPSAVKVSFADGAGFNANPDNEEDIATIIALNSTNPDGMHGATIEDWIGYDVVPGAAARIKGDDKSSAYYRTFAEAYAAAQEGETVELCGDLKLDSKLVLDEQGVSLDLNGNTITASDAYKDTTGQPHLVEVTADNVTIKGGELKATNLIKHTVNVYGANNVTLQNVTIDNQNGKGAPLVINGGESDADSSAVTLSGKVKFVTRKDTSWSYAVNVDKKNGGSASLTLAKDLVMDFGGQSPACGISVDNDGSTITFESGAQFLKAPARLLNVAGGTTVKGLENVGLTPDKTGAVATVNGVCYTEVKDAIAAVEATKAGEVCTFDLYGDVVLEKPVEVPQGAKLTVTGNGHSITLPTEGNYSAFNNTTGLEGLKEGTELTVTGVNFVGNYDEKGSGHAVVVGFEGNVKVDFDKCSFTNMYDAIYCNPVSTTAEKGNVLAIKGSKFDNVQYSCYEDMVGGKANANAFTEEENEGNAVRFTRGFQVGDTTYATLTEAIAAAGENTTVKLLQDAKLDSMLSINTKGLTLNLNGHKIYADDSFAFSDNEKFTDAHLVDITANDVTIEGGTLFAGANNNHALNVWNAKGVTVKEMVLDNSQVGTAANGGAPLVVGASDVTLEDKVTFVTGDNSWYAANVDSRMVGGTKTEASLTLAEGAKTFFTGKNPIGIYVENSANFTKPDKVNVVFGKNTSVKSDIDGFLAIVFAQKWDKPIKSTVTGAENAGLVQDENGNYYVKPAPAKPSEETTSSESTSTSSTTTTTTQSGSNIPYYTCPACGYHNWTATADGYKCDHCGYIESVKQLSGYGNVKGVYEPKTSSAAAQSASGTTATSAIPQTSDESNPMLWAFLLIISGGALASLAVFKKKKEN